MELEGRVARSEAPLPLEELDRVLRPLRRVLAYALRDPARVRFLEANAGRWLKRALGLDLPEAVRELLAVISGRLADFDQLGQPEERRRRLSGMYQALWRIDALLGLPLEGRVLVQGAPRGVSAASIEPITEEVPRGAPVVAAVPAGPVEVEIEVVDQVASFRLGDPSHTGAPLARHGVEPALAEALAAAGVHTPVELLQLKPVDEQVLRPVHGAGRPIPEGEVAVGGRVRRRVTRVGPEGMRFEFVLQGAGPLRVAFRQPPPPWLVEALAAERRVVLVGQLEQPEGHEPVLWDPQPIPHEKQQVARLQRYGLTGVDDLDVRRLIWRFLDEVQRVRDPLPAALLEAAGLISLQDALKGLHMGGPSAAQARRRLAFDEALLVQIGLASPRFQAARDRGIAHGVLHQLAARVCQFGDRDLGDAQQLALEDIKRDLRRPAPMLRVLTGAAGSGKGLVALLAAIMVAESKSQVLFLGPDPIAIEQRFLVAEPLLREVGLVGRLVGADPSSAQADAISRGEVHVVFGPVQILERELAFRRLGLVVVEEREVHGRAVRRLQAMKPPRPDALVLTPTPVPTAVLLSAYGDHDLSVVDGDGPKVRCEVHDESQRDQVYARAAQVLEQRGQVWVVFPTLRGEDALGLREAAQVVRALESEGFRERRVGLYHGAMSREERHRVYDDFRHRRLDVLVATAPIEDGPGVPAATVAIVEQADRMSLQRLMRVRGHLASTGRPAQCLLVAGSDPDAEGLEALKRLEAGEDDWRLAEWELGRRGLGAVLAPELGEPPPLRWFDPVTDRELLVWAREEALRMLGDDPALRRGGGELARAVRERWEALGPTPWPEPEPAPSGGKRRRRRRRKR